jgi:hypothetical protein
MCDEQSASVSVNDYQQSAQAIDERQLQAQSILRLLEVK